MGTKKYGILIIGFLLSFFVTGCAKKNHNPITNIDPEVISSINRELQLLDQNIKPPHVSKDEKEIIIVYGFQKMPYVAYMGKKRNFLKGAWKGMGGAASGIHGSGEGMVLVVPVMLGLGAVSGAIAECFAPSDGPISTEFSNEFAQKIAEIVNDEEFDAKLKNQIENSLTTKLSGNIISYNENSYSFDSREVISETKQNIMGINMDVKFTGPEPVMHVTNTYFIFNKFALLRKNVIKNVQENDISAAASKIKQMKEESANNYKSYDFYTSPPYPREKWLNNNGELVKTEINKAMEQLTAKMVQTLFH